MTNQDHKKINLNSFFHTRLLRSIFNYVSGDTIRPLTLVLISVFLTISLSGKEVKINTAIKLASNQGMLSQQIVKSYILIGAKVEIKSIHHELDYCVATFEENHYELEEFAPTEEIKESLDKVYNLWQEFRILAVREPNKMDAYILLNRSEDLLRACTRVVNLLEEYSNLEVSKNVHAAGRLRILSQHIAMWYFAYYWGFPESSILSFDIGQKYKSSIREYKKTFRKLAKSKHNTTEISDALKILKSYWNLPNTKLSKMKKGEMSPKLINKSMDRIKAKLKDISFMYEQL